MDGLLTGLTQSLITGGSFSLLFVFVFIMGKLLNDFVSPYSIDDELTKKDNVALAVSLSGYFLAITIVFLGALLGPGKSLWADLLNVGSYSLFGIVLLNVSRWINDKFLLYKFCNIKEIVEDRNAGTGAVQFGSYIASGFIVAGAIHGEGGGPLTALVFFFLGQVVLIIFAFIYNAITSYDIHDEIEKDNVAAGVAFGGTLVALGIILMKGSAGHFISWRHNLGYFGLETLLAFVMLPLIRIFFDKVLIRKADLNKEIQEDKNLGAGLLEMTVAIGFASVLYFVM